MKIFRPKPQKFSTSTARLLGCFSMSVILVVVEFLVLVLAFGSVVVVVYAEHILCLLTAVYLHLMVFLDIFFALFLPCL